MFMFEFELMYMFEFMYMFEMVVGDVITWGKPHVDEMAVLRRMYMGSSGITAPVLLSALALIP